MSACLPGCVEPDEPWCRVVVGEVALNVAAQDLPAATLAQLPRTLAVEVTQDRAPDGSAGARLVWLVGRDREGRRDDGWLVDEQVAREVGELVARAFEVAGPATWTGGPR